MTSLKNKSSMTTSKSQITMKNLHNATLNQNKISTKKMIGMISLTKKINMIGMKSKLINPSPRNLRKRIKTISPTTSLISIMAPRVNRLMVHQLRLMTLQAKYLTITLKKQKKISWLVRQPCQVSKTKSLKSTMLKASRLNRSKVLQLL